LKGVILQKKSIQREKTKIKELKRLRRKDRINPIKLQGDGNHDSKRS